MHLVINVDLWEPGGSELDMKARREWGSGMISMAHVKNQVLSNLI